MQTNIVNRSKTHMETLHKYDWKKINFILTITQQHAYERACPSSGYRLCRGEGHLNYYLNGHHRDDCAQRNPNPLENEDPLIFLITSVFDTKTKTRERLFSLFFFFFPKRLENVKFRFKTFFKGANYQLLFFKGSTEHKMFVFKIRYWIYPLTCGHIFAPPTFNPNQVPWDQWATYNILGIYIYLSLRNVRLCFPKKRKLRPEN